MGAPGLDFETWESKNLNKRNSAVRKQSSEHEFPCPILSPCYWRKGGKAQTLTCSITHRGPDVRPTPASPRYRSRRPPHPGPPRKTRPPHVSSIGGLLRR